MASPLINRTGFADCALHHERPVGIVRRDGLADQRQGPSHSGCCDS